MNKHVKEHIEYLELQEADLAITIKSRPKAKDIDKAREQLRGIRAVLRQLKK